MGIEEPRNAGHLQHRLMDFSCVFHVCVKHVLFNWLLRSHLVANHSTMNRDKFSLVMSQKLLVKKCHMKP